MFKFKGANLAEIQKELKEVSEKYSLAKSATDYQILSVYLKEMEMILATHKQNGLECVACPMLDLDWWKDSEENDTVANDFVQYVQESWHGKLADMALALIEVSTRQRRVVKPTPLEGEMGDVLEVMLESIKEIVKNRGNVVKGDHIDNLLGGIVSMFDIDGVSHMLPYFMSLEMDVTLQNAVPDYRRENFNVTTPDEKKVYALVVVQTELGIKDFCMALKQKDLNRQILAKKVEEHSGEKVKAFISYPQLMSEEAYELWTKAEMKVSK